MNIAYFIIILFIVLNFCFYVMNKLFFLSPCLPIKFNRILHIYSKRVYTVTQLSQLSPDVLFIT